VMVPLAWGSGMNNTATSALASQLTPPDEQGGLFGVINAIQGIGRILGPAIGTLVYARWGYEASYWVAAVVVALGLPMALLLPKREIVAQLEPVP
jgi:MFS transporter, DHA1 family, tetracycline resistance protein